MENNTMEQNPIPINEPQKKLHIQKPNNKVVFGILALFVIALVFILLYIFVLQEGEEQEQEGESTTRNDIEEEKQQEGGSTTRNDIEGIEEEQEVIHKIPSYDTIIATQDDYEFVYFGTGSEKFFRNLNIGLNLCEFVVKGHPNAETLLAEFNEFKRNNNQNFYTNKPNIYVVINGSFPFPKVQDWNMTDYSTSFLLNSAGPVEYDVRVQLVDETDADWVIACNSIDPQGTATSFAKQGIGRQVIVTDLVAGDYECRFDLRDGSSLDDSGELRALFNSENEFRSRRIYVRQTSLENPFRDLRSSHTFLLRVSKTNQPPIFEFSGLRPWSIVCNLHELKEESNPATVIPSVDVGTRAFEHTGVGEEQVEFKQDNGFYVCTLNIPQIPKADLAFGLSPETGLIPQDGFYPSIKLNVVYQNKESHSKIRPWFWRGSTDIQLTFFIRNGALNNVVSALELEIVPPRETIESFNWNENIRWYVACNALKQQKIKTTITAQGTGSTYIPTNLQTGSYMCTLSTLNSQSPEGWEGWGVHVNVYPYTYKRSVDNSYLLDHLSRKVSSFENPTDKYEFGFSVNTKNEFPPLMYVNTEQKTTEWSVQCNQLKPSNRVTQFTQTGSRSLSFISNLNTGTHRCHLEAVSVQIQMDIYVDNEMVVLVRKEGSQKIANFQIVNTSDTLSPEISVRIDGTGMRDWTIRCGV